jgi:hypothetical protein
MAANITLDQTMIKSCGVNPFSSNGILTPTYPGASGNILFDHNINSDLTKSYQQCLYKDPIYQSTYGLRDYCTIKN